MSIPREMNLALKTLERGLRAPSATSEVRRAPFFVWRENEYPCTPGRAARSKRHGVGGFTLLADLVLFVRRELLPVPNEGVTPVLSVKDEIVFRGETYNVDEIEDDPSAAFLKLTCNHPARGG